MNSIISQSEGMTVVVGFRHWSTQKSNPSGVGRPLGLVEGKRLGKAVGQCEGLDVNGDIVGSCDGFVVDGDDVGMAEGFVLGKIDGESEVGFIDGKEIEGVVEGAENTGLDDGDLVGASDDGGLEGSLVGSNVG